MSDDETVAANGGDASPPDRRRPQSPRSNARKIAVRALLIVLVAAGAAVAWRFLIAGPQPPANVLQLSGRMEGDDSAVAPKTAGRIVAVTVREGDLVKAGQTIATLDDEQLRAREQQAGAALVAAQAKSEAARAQIAILEEQLKQYQLQSEQAQTDAEGRVRQAEADVAAAEAALKQQEASYELAAFDRDAYTRLAKTGAVSERQGKLSVSTAEQQGAALAAMRRKAEASKGALQIARANLATPGIRNLQVAGIRRQMLQQQAESRALPLQTRAARFQLQEAEANRSDLVVRAPLTERSLQGLRNQARS